MVSTRLELNPHFRRFAVGFDNLFDELNRFNTVTDNYPPFNLVKLSEDEFVVEFAVAGFSEGDLDVKEHKGLLTVTGTVTKSTEDEKLEYVHKGISSKSFEKSFKLADYFKVIGAEVNSGILRVALKREVPEEAKPKSVAITFKP
jgi:molecular chaperone IbpA